MEQKWNNFGETSPETFISPHSRIFTSLLWRTILGNTYTDGRVQYTLQFTQMSVVSLK